MSETKCAALPCERLSPIGTRILLVEDSEPDARLVGEMLKSAHPPFAIQRAPRLAPALGELERGGYEAVLLDLGLPDSQGLETLVRLVGAFPDVAVVVLSGLADEELAVQAVRLGAQDYVVKGRYDGALLARVLHYAIERVRGERALRESEEQYRRIFEESPHPMWVVDGERDAILAANLAAVESHGWSETELLDMTLEALVPPERQAELRRVLREVAASGSGVRLGDDGVWRHRTRDGGSLEVQLSVSPMPFAGSTALLVQAVDVTELRRLQRLLLQAAKMEAVGHLAGGVAHDFNNLLVVVGGHADSLTLSGSLDEAREAGRQIAEAVEQGRGLTRRLLAFSRRQELAPQVVELDRLVGDAVGVLGRLIGGRVRVVVRRGAGDACTLADPVQLQQVLMNLAVNARDAMPEGGTLRIETSLVDAAESPPREHPEAGPGPWVRLVVADTGVGMDGETLAHAFEPFFTTKGAERGTGLGLATVYGIVRQSGGVVDVESAPGEGTEFRILLPLVEQETSS